MRWPAAAILYTISGNANAFSPMMKKVALIWRSLSVFRTRSVLLRMRSIVKRQKDGSLRRCVVVWTSKPGAVSNAFGRLTSPSSSSSHRKLSVNRKSCAVLPGASVTLQVPDPVMSLYLPLPPMSAIVPLSGPFVGHEELVPVGVGVDACAGEGVAFGPRFGILLAADREVVQELRPVPGLHDADAFRRRI